MFYIIFGSLILRCTQPGFPYEYFLTMKWTENDIPCQEGRTALVTGANSGLGFQISRALALKGARVIMACRNEGKGKEARRRILAMNPPLEPELGILDLASLGSVKRFSRDLLDKGLVPHVLVNNAGTMAIPLARTREGFEMQFGVSHLGHFALTARLWPGIRERDEARIVQVSSLMHRQGKIRFEDPGWERVYHRWKAYGMAKLAGLLFIKELDRRMSECGLPVMALAAHPGYAATSLQENSMKLAGARVRAGLFRFANRIAAQPAWKGALPVLYAATASGIRPGGYFGPGGPLRLHGWPGEETPHPERVNAEDARRLWELSEELTGCSFPVL